MKTDVNFSDFIDRFKAMDRYAQFGYDGLRCLYDYLVNMENDCDVEIELDVIGLCCEFTKYDDVQECLDDYSLSDIDELRECTSVIECSDNGVVVHSF